MNLWLQLYMNGIISKLNEFLLPELMPPNSGLNYDSDYGLHFSFFNLLLIFFDYIRSRGNFVCFKRYGWFWSKVKQDYLMTA